MPKYCSEEQFWNRYFAAVERVKQQVKTEQMWGDFDMLDSDGIEPSGEPLQTMLPFSGQQAAYVPMCILESCDIIMKATHAACKRPTQQHTDCTSPAQSALYTAVHRQMPDLLAGFVIDLESTKFISPMASIHHDQVNSFASGGHMLCGSHLCDTTCLHFDNCIG